MRIILITFITLSLLGCNYSNNDKYTALNLMASGEIQLQPDIANIKVGISCTNKNLSASTECTKQGISDLFILLESHKVAKDDYHSSSISLQKDFTWKNNSKVFVGYKSSSTISVVFKNIDIMGTVIAQVMQMDMANIYGLNYSHSQLESYSNKAYLKALDNATTLAQEMKEKLGAKSVKILKISNISAGIDAPQSLILQEAAVASLHARKSSAIQVNPGSLVLVKNIYVQYRVYH